MLLLLHTTSTSTCLGHSHNLGSTLLATPASELLLVLYIQNVQGYTKRWSQGLVNFVSALAYHFYLALPAEFTQPGNHLLAELCTSIPLDFGLSGGEKRLRRRWWHLRTTVKRQVAPVQFRAARRLHLEVCKDTSDFGSPTLGPFTPHLTLLM